MLSVRIFAQGKRTLHLSLLSTVKALKTILITLLKVSNTCSLLHIFLKLKFLLVLTRLYKCTLLNLQRSAETQKFPRPDAAATNYCAESGPFCYFTYSLLKMSTKKQERSSKIRWPTTVTAKEKDSRQKK